MRRDDALVPEVEAALRAALSRTPKGSRRSWRARLFAVPVVVAVLGGTALAATGVWRPSLGSDQLGHPTTSNSSVPVEQLRLLGVLRRPQVDADRGPVVEDILKHGLSSRTDAGGVAGVRTDAIRRIATTSTTTWILVPVKRVRYQIGPTAKKDERNVLCVISRSPWTGPDGVERFGYGSACRTTHDVALGRLAGGAASDRHLSLWGVVPDGVDKVKARLRGGKGITVKVRDNTYVVDATIPQRAWLGHYVWYDRAGNVIRRR